MASIGFRIRSKANKPVSIYTYVNMGSGIQTIEVKTGFTIHPNDWSKKKQQPKQSTGVLKNLNYSIQELKNALINEINNSLTKSTIYDNNWLRKSINNHFNRVDKVDDSIIINSISAYIANAKVKRGAKGKIGLDKKTIDRWNYFQNVFFEFQKHTEEALTFSALDRDFVDSFTNWLLEEKKYSKNSAGKFISQLKTICKDAYSRGVDVPLYFLQIKGFKEPKNERILNIISIEEQKKIKELKLESQSLENIRKWILIGLSIGQRISDLLLITKENVRFNKDGYMIIDIIQKKTGSEVSPVIADKEIIELVYPDLPYKISEQKFNKYMKMVCKKASIDKIVKGYKMNSKTNRKEIVNLPKYEMLSSHDLRRSFATNYFDIVPTSILMNLTGHTKESTFLEYIGKSQNKDYYADAFIKAIQS
jgi:integrase